MSSVWQISTIKNTYFWLSGHVLVATCLLDFPSPCVYFPLRRNQKKWTLKDAKKQNKHNLICKVCLLFWQGDTLRCIKPNHLTSNKSKVNHTYVKCTVLLIFSHKLLIFSLVFFIHFADLIYLIHNNKSWPGPQDKKILVCRVFHSDICTKCVISHVHITRSLNNFHIRRRRRQTAFKPVTAVWDCFKYS